MADNYHIDKNSKLFQKFLNLKSKNSSEVQEAPKYQLPKREKPSQFDTSQTNQRATLHMSIDDIEEAASMVQEEQHSQLQQFTFNSKSEQAAQMRQAMRIERLRERYTMKNCIISLYNREFKMKKLSQNQSWKFHDLKEQNE
jgi:4-hydroxy-L-threonine phosphate dehydrogenase PdxA